MDQQIRINPDGLAAQLRAAADAVSRLFASHLKLARLELVEEANAIGSRAPALLGFALVASVGYLFVALGIADLLLPVTGTAGTLLLLGAAQLLGGGTMLVVVVKQLTDKKPNP